MAARAVNPGDGPVQTLLNTKQVMFLRWALEGMPPYRIARIENVGVSEVYDSLERAATALGAKSIRGAVRMARARSIL